MIPVVQNRNWINIHFRTGFLLKYPIFPQSLFPPIRINFGGVRLPNGSESNRPRFPIEKYTKGVFLGNGEGRRVTG
jgi:hypothetical protein